MQLKPVENLPSLFAPTRVRIKAIELLQKYVGASEADSVRLESQLYTQYYRRAAEYLRAVRRIAYNTLSNPLVKERVPLLLLHAQTNEMLRKGTEVDRWHTRMDERAETMRRLLQADGQSEPGGGDSEDGGCTPGIVCLRCKSGDVMVEQKQTRSADEGMTVFVSCNKCALRWRM